MTDFWKTKRVIVTGGAGFLGSFVVAMLRERGASEVIVPLIEDYDLTQLPDIRRLLSTESQIVIRLAAKVGGIGANRDHPAEFFYDNLMMGVQLLQESWKAGAEKFVAVSTVCSYPKYAPVPFREEDLWNGYPEETNAPYGLAKGFREAAAGNRKAHASHAAAGARSGTGPCSPVLSPPPRAK